MKIFIFVLIKLKHILINLKHVHTKLSNRFATIEANLLSPAKSDIKKKYSGALT